MSLNPFDLGKNIIHKSEHIDEVGKEYDKYIIDVIFSNSPSSIMYANEINTFTPNITKQMCYDVYYHGVNRQQYLGKWNKVKKHDDPELVDYIKTYYNYSHSKALEILELLDDETILEIKDDIFILNNPSKRLPKRKTKLKKGNK